MLGRPEQELLSFKPDTGTDCLSTYRWVPAKVKYSTIRCQAHRTEVNSHARIPNTLSQHSLGLWYALHVLVGLRSNAIPHRSHASEEDDVDYRHGHLHTSRHTVHTQTRLLQPDGALQRVASAVSSQWSGSLTSNVLETASGIGRGLLSSLSMRTVSTIVEKPDTCVQAHTARSTVLYKDNALQ